MVWIIAIIAILGNIYLFGGYEIEGELAGYLVGIAVCADIFVVYRIIKSLVTKGKGEPNSILSTRGTHNHGKSMNTSKETSKSPLQYPTVEKASEIPVTQSTNVSSVKCPVCKAKLASSVSKCSICGFGDLRREFINAEDAATWFENVVVPYRVKWEQSKSQPAFSPLMSFMRR